MPLHSVYILKREWESSGDSPSFLLLLLLPPPLPPPWAARRTPLKLMIDYWANSTSARMGRAWCHLAATEGNDSVGMDGWYMINDGRFYFIFWGVGGGFNPVEMVGKGLEKYLNPL